MRHEAGGQEIAVGERGAIVRHQDSDTANVITFPPLIPLAGLGLSLVLKLLRPLPITPKWLAKPRRKAGLLLIVGGCVTAAWVRSSR